jgi:hypothetical protein
MARAYDEAVPGGIEEVWRERMNEALKDLAGDLRSEGTVARAPDAGAD